MRGIQEPKCRHQKTVEVKSYIDDEVLAYICLNCDEQLPPDWVDEGNWIFS